MKSSYKIKLSGFSQEGLQNVIKMLETVFQQYGVDFYLIGALAKDVWLSQESIPARATKDVDLAVFVDNAADYEKVKSALVENHGFRMAAENKFRLYTPFGYPVDLVPFGSIEIDEAVILEGEGLTRIHVNAFKEVYQQGVSSILSEEGLSFKIASLPSIVLLKLLAYDDRPEHRTQDIKDIALIMRHYFDIESNHIFNHHNDLFGDEMELIDIAAMVIGRELKPVLSENEQLKERVISIVLLSYNHHKRIPELMAAGEHFTVDQAVSLLKQIRKGIE